MTESPVHHGPLVLVGPTGAGKSTVAPLLAMRLGRRFVDLDHHVEATAGRRIGEIFEQDGEGAFRQLETLALEEALGDAGAVVACGAGVVLDPRNRDLLREHAVTIHLDAGVRQQLERLRERSDRPLLAFGDRESVLETMARQRGPLYAGVADLHIDTGARTAHEVVEELLSALPLLTAATPGATEAQRLEVDSPRGPYDIHVGNGLLADGTDLIAAVRGRRVMIVSDTSVAPLYLPVLRATLRRHRPGLATHVHLLPPGEPGKSIDHWRALTEALAAFGATRDATVIALGGGAVGDLAGFAAATWMRGIDVVQVPTTLLAMVDSSVGGKTAVDLPAGKNLVGAFHPPSKVVADTGTLATLPARELRAGLAEVVKYGAIFDAGFLAWVEANADALLARDADAIREAVLQSCRFKAAVVARDPFEHGERALLNFGHTFAHAIETEQGYAGASGGLVHGEAVSVGMVLAARLSTELGLAPVEDAARLQALLDRLGLPTRLPDGLSPDALLERMRLDKKADARGLRFVLWDGAGRARTVPGVPDAPVLEVLSAGHAPA